MYKIMNAYMSKVQLQTGPELQQRLCDIVNSIKEIKSFRSQNISNNLRLT